MPWQLSRDQHVLVLLGLVGPAQRHQNIATWSLSRRRFPREAPFVICRSWANVMAEVSVLAAPSRRAESACYELCGIYEFICKWPLCNRASGMDVSHI